MPFRPVRWFLSNRFLHLHSYLKAPMAHESVPIRLRSRLAARLASAQRLVRVRLGLLFVIYSGVLGALIRGLVEVGEQLGFENEFLASLAEVVVLVLGILAPLIIVALLGLVLVNRALSLIDADIMMLGAEAIGRSLAAGGPVPSQQYVRRTKP